MTGTAATEEQEFIKQAQQGDINESSADELQEVLAKIYEKDPYVFDDVDNEVKIDNRIESVILESAKINITISSPEQHDEVREILTVCNCGNIENVSAEEAKIIYDMNAGTNANEFYFSKIVLPDYKSNNWKGNYNNVFDFSKFLLDGSQGQKIAKKIYQANVTFFNSEKEDVEEGLKTFISECLNVLLVNDALQKPDGINSVNSLVHYNVIYRYCDYIIFFMPLEMELNNVYSFPDEYAQKVGISNSELSFGVVQDILERYLGSPMTLVYNAFGELEQIQLEKYGNTIHIQRREETNN
jgi:hypothetical protein